MSESDERRAAEFAALVGPLLGRLGAFARRRMASAEDAEDLVQDACARAWLSYDSLRDPSRAAPWLFRILKGVIGDEYAKRSRRRALVSISRLDDVYERLLVSSDDPHANVAARMTQERIEAVLREIPEDFATVVELHDMEGFRYVEIAEIIDRPVGTVMSRLSRGRRLVAAMLYGSHAKGDAMSDGQDATNAPARRQPSGKMPAPNHQTFDG